MLDFGYKTPEYIFGATKPATLDSIRPDFAFLSWGDESNAAAVIPKHIEEVLSSIATIDRVSLDATINAKFGDRIILAYSLARQWQNEKGDESPRSGPIGPSDDAGFLWQEKEDDAPFLRLFGIYLGISRDEGAIKQWKEASRLLSQGTQLYHQSRPNEAIDFYIKALRRFETVGDAKGAGMCRGNIGLVYLDAGEYGKAIEECRAALELHESVRYERGQVSHLINIGRAHIRLQQWEPALEVVRRKQAIERWVNPTLAAISEAEIGLCQYHLGLRAEAEGCYERALRALGKIQTPHNLDPAAEQLARLAALVGDVAQMDELVSEAKANLIQALRSVDPSPAPMSAPILRQFDEALQGGDEDGLHQALALSQRWSILALESLLAQAAIYQLAGYGAQAEALEAKSEYMALRICRSFLVRWPLDEVKLFKSWSLEKRVAKARVYDLKIRAMLNAWSRQEEAALQQINSAYELHALIGDRDVVGPWFPEARRELSFEDSSRAQMYRLVMRSGTRADSAGALNDLTDALKIAQEKGSLVNVADKFVRLAILNHQIRDMVSALKWFKRADRAFKELEGIGPSLLDEVGRANNKIKMAVHLGEFLIDAGRSSEAIFVFVKILHEANWFLDVLGTHQGPPSEWFTRAQEYKGRILYGLTRAYTEIGSYEKAVQYAQDALGWFEQTNNSTGRAAAHHALASAYMRLGLFPEALQSAQIDLAIQRVLGRTREIAVALNTLADIYLKLDDLDNAHESLTEALTLSEGGDPAVKSDALFGLAQIEQRRGNWKETHRLYARSLEIDRARSAEDRIPSTLTALAQVSLLAGSVDQAAAYAQEAWTRSASVQSFLLRINAGYFFARCKLMKADAGSWLEAASVLNQVCGLIAKMRREIQREDLRIYQSISLTEPYNLLIKTLVELSDYDSGQDFKAEAFNVVEWAKARSLVEAIASKAQKEAEEQSGVRTGGIFAHVADPREELPHLGFKEVLKMLKEDLGVVQG